MKMVSKLPSLAELKRMGIDLYDKNGKSKSITTPAKIMKNEECWFVFC